MGSACHRAPLTLQNVEILEGVNVVALSHEVAHAVALDLVLEAARRALEIVGDLVLAL